MAAGVHVVQTDQRRTTGIRGHRPRKGKPLAPLPSVVAVPAHAIQRLKVGPSSHAGTYSVRGTAVFAIEAQHAILGSTKPWRCRRCSGRRVPITNGTIRPTAQCPVSVDQVGTRFAFWVSKRGG